MAKPKIYYVTWGDTETWASIKLAVEVCQKWIDLRECFLEKIQRIIALPQILCTCCLQKNLSITKIEAVIIQTNFMKMGSSVR